MDTPDGTPNGPPARSARELLELFHYGHYHEVEQILRFAREHRLEDDNLVFLLVAILKGNETLVQCILEAIVGTERVIDNSREAGKELRALEQQIIAQVEGAAARSAGRLNLAADRLTRTVAQVDELCEGILSAARGLVRVEGVLDRALEIREGGVALDRLSAHIRLQALADLRGYHAEIVEGLADEVGKQVRFLHCYGVIGVIFAILALIASYF